VRRGALAGGAAAVKRLRRGRAGSRRRLSWREVDSRGRAAGGGKPIGAEWGTGAPPGAAAVSLARAPDHRLFVVAWARAGEPTHRGPCHELELVFAERDDVVVLQQSASWLSTPLRACRWCCRRPRGAVVQESWDDDRGRRYGQVVDLNVVVAALAGPSVRARFRGAEVPRATTSSRLSISFAIADPIGHFRHPNTLPDAIARGPTATTRPSITKPLGRAH